MLPVLITPMISTLGIMGNLFSCPKFPNPVVNVYVKEERLVLDNNKNREQLKNLNVNSISPIYGTEFPQVSGLTSSTINVTADTSFTIASNPMLKRTCIAVQQVDIHLNYSPIVYIYKNFRAGSCMYNEVLQHEMQHVQVDRNALSAFRPYIEKAGRYAINVTLEKEAFHMADLENKKTNIAKSISTAVNFATRKMQEQLVERQRQIDTPEEYRRLSNVCPHENKL